jgi:hypothetical protein
MIPAQKSQDKIKKLSDERLDECIKIYDEGVYQQPSTPLSMYEIQSLLLENKQFRAVAKHRAHSKRKPSRVFVN